MVDIIKFLGFYEKSLRRFEEEGFHDVCTFLSTEDLSVARLRLARLEKLAQNSP